MSDYKRVIPRDFFNEAKLLKCMGLLALKELDQMLPKGVDIRIESRSEEKDAGFDIYRDEGNDGLYVGNYNVVINDEIYTAYTKYNSKDNYPLYIQDEDYVDYLVFDEQGEFTDEFIQRFKDN